MSLDQPVGSPLDGVAQIGRLIGKNITLKELDTSPRKNGERMGERQRELEVVPGVIVAPDQVHAVVLAIGEARIVTPVGRRYI
ncbi:hypothetical protein BC938DRAFT_476497 [Jimgerdemannia flammicorona]|uniref:Uncharacterized protein n=1 Tax=Jimgerdemannia flammicorona TaxID=994334 RepID=A0A433QQF0_9FUNG|nr:hypothetical protein BC938DRAFT_476497 [Jimgerdemannia flammicorona]